MSKKQTRKGLAFGTSVALGLVSLTGASPALAVASVDPVSLSPNGGTSYNTLSGSAFELRSVLSLSALSNEAQDDAASNADGVYSDETLKFLINDPDNGLHLDYPDYSGDESYGAIAFGTNNDGNEWYSFGEDDYDSSTDSTWDTEGTYTSDVDDNINLTYSDGLTVIDTHQRPLGKTSVLRLMPDNYGDSFSVDVTAWVDWNNDNLVNNGETASPTRTVNFVGHQDLNVNTTIDAFTNDDYVDFDAEFTTSLVSEDDNVKLNTVQLAREEDNNGDWSTFIDVSNDPDSPDYAGGSGEDYIWAELNFEADDADVDDFAGNSLSWNFTAVEGKINFDDNDLPFNLDAGEVSVDFYQWSDYDDYDYDITTITETVAEVYVNDVIVSLKDTADTNANGAIRAGVKSATIEVEVLDNNGDAVAAGTEITVTVDASTYPVIKTGDSVTVGGKAIVNRNANAAFELVVATDKDGMISIPVVATSGLAGNSFELNFESENGNTDSITLSWADAAPSAATTYIMEQPADITAMATIVSSGSATFTIGAFDQFGGAVSGNDYKVVVDLYDTDYSGSDLQASSGAKVATVDDPETASDFDNDMRALTISGGKATFTYKYNGVSPLDDWAYLEFAVVEIDDDNTDFYGNIEDALNDNYAFAEVNIMQKENTIPAAIEVYDSSPTATGARQLNGAAIDLANDDLTAYDARTQVGTEGTYADSARVEAYISVAEAGDQTDDSEGTAVTVSGSGLLFEALDPESNSGSGVYGLGSLTLQSDVDGEVAFYVYGNKSGDQTVTLKAGSVTQQVIITFAEAASNKATAIALNVPTVVTPGTSIAGFGLLTDKYGNAVQSGSGSATFEIEISGITGGEELFASADSDADGRFSFGYSTATSSNGLVTVTVTYDADGTGTTESAITKTATVKVGKPSTAVVSGGDNKVTTVVKNSNGQTVKVYVGKVLKKTVIATSNKQTISTKVKKTGNRKVKVVVDGQTIASKTVSVF